MTNDTDNIISRQLQMFELSKHIEAKSEGKWTQFQRDTVPFILWKISESEEGMSYPEVLSCLEQFDSLCPLLLRYEVEVLLSLIELSECGVLEQSEDCDNYEDEHCKFRWNKEATRK